MFPEYFQHVTLKFCSHIWWVFKHISLIVQEKAIVILEEQTRELILTGNDKFKLSSSARKLQSEYKSILKLFTLAGQGKGFLLGLRKSQFLLLFSCFTSKNMGLGSFTAHLHFISPIIENSELLTFPARLWFFFLPASIVRRGKSTFSIPPTIVLQNLTQIMYFC